MALNINKCHILYDFINAYVFMINNSSMELSTVLFVFTSFSKTHSLTAHSAFLKLQDKTGFIIYKG